MPFESDFVHAVDGLLSSWWGHWHEEQLHIDLTCTSELLKTSHMNLFDLCFFRDMCFFKPWVQAKWFRKEFVRVLVLFVHEVSVEHRAHCIQRSAPSRTAFRMQPVYMPVVWNMQPRHA